MTDRIIHSEDGQTYDLTQNRITFGLLPKDVQEAMKAWPHGWEMYDGYGAWGNRIAPGWASHATYRAVPALKVVEHVLYCREGGHALRLWPNPADTHRIIIRDDGKGNITATVEAL
jgi:hypothetical protein